MPIGRCNSSLSSCTDAYAANEVLSVAGARIVWVQSEALKASSDAPSAGTALYASAAHQAAAGILLCADFQGTVRVVVRRWKRQTYPCVQWTCSEQRCKVCR
jgi:hypothetical protein